MSALIPLENVNALALFTGDGELDSLLREIENTALDFEPDLSTEAGRKEIASQAYKVARSKVVIDEAGKDLVRDWKEKAKRVDTGRKQARDFLDALRDRVREPLSEWEAEQEAIRAAEQLRLEIDAAHGEALEMNALIDKERELVQRQAEIEAKERAAAEAERQKRLEQEAKEQAERAAQERIERAEREARESKEREERAKIAAQEREKFIAEQAEREKAEAVRREQARAKAEQEAAERQRLAREKDRANRARVHREALAALVAGGIDEATGKDVLRLIVGGKVPHVRVTY